MKNLRSEWILICILFLMLTTWGCIEVRAMGTVKAAACLGADILPQITAAAPADPAKAEKTHMHTMPVSQEHTETVTVSEQSESGSDTEKANDNTDEMTYMGAYWVTGYDICTDCCGNTEGICASGAAATLGRTVAAGEEFPFGTVLYIEGIGYRIVEDRGGAVTGGILDVLCSDHTECREITGYRNVYVVE